MWISLRNSVVQLEENRPVSFRDACGTSLHCVSGMVWVTIAGQPGDFLLHAGEHLQIESSGLAVVEGMPAGAITLHAATPWPIRGANLILRPLVHSAYRLLARPVRGARPAGRARPEPAG